MIVVSYNLLWRLDDDAYKFLIKRWVKVVYKRGSSKKGRKSVCTREVLTSLLSGAFQEVDVTIVVLSLLVLAVKGQYVPLVDENRLFQTLLAERGS